MKVRRAKKTIIGKVLRRAGFVEKGFRTSILFVEREFGKGMAKAVVAKNTTLQNQNTQLEQQVAGVSDEMYQNRYLLKAHINKEYSTMTR